MSKYNSVIVLIDPKGLNESKCRHNDHCSEGDMMSENLLVRHAKTHPPSTESQPLSPPSGYVKVVASAPVTSGTLGITAASSAFCWSAIGFSAIEGRKVW